MRRPRVSGVWRLKKDNGLSVRLRAFRVRARATSVVWPSHGTVVDD